jgi:hypothetical protein
MVIEIRMPNRETVSICSMCGRELKYIQGTGEKNLKKR